MCSVHGVEKDGCFSKHSMTAKTQPETLSVRRSLEENNQTHLAFTMSHIYEKGQKRAGCVGFRMGVTQVTNEKYAAEIKLCERK